MVRRAARAHGVQENRSQNLSHRFARPPLKNRSRALLLLALAQLAIGAAAIFGRFALTGTGPFAAAALRLGIASLPVVAFAIARGAYARYDRATECRSFLAGVALAAHFAAFLGSLLYADVAVSTILICTSSIFTEGWLILRTHAVRTLTLAGIVAAIGGVAIIASAPAHHDSWRGIVLAIAGAVFFAVYLLLVGASDARYTTLAVVARTYPVATIALTFAAACAHERVPALGNGISWGGIVAMALLSQLFGHTALNAAVRTFGATLVGITTLLEPAIAAAIAAGVFGERLTPAGGIGALVTLGGIALALRDERMGNAWDTANQGHMHDNEPELGEQMNRGLGLDPGFVPDRTGGLLDALDDEISDTAARAKAAPKPPQPDV